MASVPGLNRNFVYYLESQGYIKPRKLRRARIARRDYSDEDLQTLRDMWPLYQRGMSVQAAYQLLTQEQRLVSFVTLEAPQRSWTALFDALREVPIVSQVSAVYGTNVDFVVETRSPDEGGLYYELLPALARAAFSGPPSVFKTTRFFHRDAASGGDEKRMLAYVFMKVPGKDVSAVMQELQRIDEVLEAAVVYGETDIILKVAAADQEALDTLVMDRLHAIAPVESTRTFVAINRLHWQREAGGVASSKRPQEA